MIIIIIRDSTPPIRPIRLVFLLRLNYRRVPYIFIYQSLDIRNIFINQSFIIHQFIIITIYIMQGVYIFRPHIQIRWVDILFFVNIRRGILVVSMQKLLLWWLYAWLFSTWLYSTLNAVVTFFFIYYRIFRFFNFYILVVFFHYYWGMIVA